MLSRKWIIMLSVAFIGYAVISAKYQEMQKTVPVGSDSSMKKIATDAISSFATSETGEKMIEKAFKSDGPLVKKEAAPKNPLPVGMVVLDSVIGDGDEVECGQTVTVHYVLSYLDRGKLDSTRDNNHPVSFIVGKRKVIRGLELGVIGMQAGGIRKLTIPAKLAYDDPLFATKTVPPFSMLKAEVEVLSVTPTAKGKQEGISCK